MRAGAAGGVAAGTAGQHRPAALAAGVNGAEARCGEGGEHARMGRYGLGYPFAPGEPGADELPGVTFVDGRAGRAGGLAAVTAGDLQHSARLGGGVIHAAQLAGGQVDGVDAALEPDRVRAQAGALGLADLARQLVPRQGDGRVAYGGLSQPRTRVRAGAEGDRRGGHELWPPQRCWAAWRVTPSRVPISAQE